MSRQRQFVFLVCLFAFALLIRQAKPTAQSEGPESFTIGPNDLALSFVNSAEEPRSATRIQRGIDAGAKLDRFPLYWDRIEPAAGQSNWSAQDTALAANEAQGLGTLAILLGTSPAYWPREVEIPPDMPQVGEGLRDVLSKGQELACTIQGTPPAVGLFNPIYADGTDIPDVPSKVINPDNPWARFVGQAVQRYRVGGTEGRNVRYWEIWNEPDLCHFWGGTSQEYARLLKVAYLVIKNIDPQATVIWGGLALYGPKYEGGANFLNEIVAYLRTDPMAADHGGFFDAAAVHQYSNVTHGYHNTRKVQIALAGTGWEGKPVWITESGVPVCDSYPGPDCPSPYRGNSTEQASYIWQNIAYTRLINNHGPIFHFQLHDDGGNECRPAPPADGFGLVTNEPGVQCVPHNAEPRLAYTAYQLAAQYIATADLLWAEIQDGLVRQVAFYDPAVQERRLLVWAIDGQDATAHVPATADSAQKVSLDGSRTTITAVNNYYDIPVSAATNQNQPNSSTYTIGGVPYMLLESDTHPPSGTIHDLLPISPPTFNVQWEMNDSGSGIEANSVDLWVEADNGGWQKWLMGQPESGGAQFTGEAGVSYRFAVQGNDQAGNSGNALKDYPETRITDGSEQIAMTGQVLTMNGQPAAWASVRVGNIGGFANGTGEFNFNVPLGQWDVVIQGQVQQHGRFFMEPSPLALILPPPNNPVANGDFESEDASNIPGWTRSGSSPSAQEELPETTDKVLRLATSFVPSPGVPGQEGSDGGNSTVVQQLTVPAGQPHLTLAYKVESEETDGGNGSCGNPGILHDKFEIIIAHEGDPANYIHCQEIASDWRFVHFDLSAYAGEQIQLILNLYESSPNRRTSALVDLLMIGQSPVLSPPTQIFLPLLQR